MYCYKLCNPFLGQLRELEYKALVSYFLFNLLCFLLGPYFPTSNHRLRNPCIGLLYPSLNELVVVGSPSKPKTQCLGPRVSLLGPTQIYFQNIKFPYTSFFTSFPCNSYFITMSLIPINKDYYPKCNLYLVYQTCPWCSICIFLDFYFFRIYFRLVLLLLSA